MDYGKIVLLIVVTCSLFWVLIKLICAKRLKRVIFNSLLAGVLTLSAVCALGQFQVETLHINPYTLGVSSVLGIPGVVSMLALQLILAV